MSYVQKDEATQTKPNAEGVSVPMKEVEITFSAVFRRNYAWGRFAFESWQQTNGTRAERNDNCPGLGCFGNENSDQLYQRVEPDPALWQCGMSGCDKAYQKLGLAVLPGEANSYPSVDVTSEYTADMNENNAFAETFYMRFPPYNGGVDWEVDPTAPLSEQHYVQPCPSAFYCDIVKPNCSKANYTWSQNANGEDDFTRPPETALSPECDTQNESDDTAEAWFPKKCGEWYDDGSGNPCNGITTCANYTKTWDPLDSGATRCAAWPNIYGMYMGDNKARTVVLTSTDIEVSCLTEAECAGDNKPLGCDRGCSAFTGNFIRGVEKFTYWYPYMSAKPFTLFFTGGNRLFQCNHHTGYVQTGLDPSGSFCMENTGNKLNDLDNLLNNNQEGRYRLEMEIWLFPDNNKSPVVYQEAVLPVVRSITYEHRTPFQIPTYDLDFDYLVFRFGNPTEMGGITKTKMGHYPYTEADQSTADAVFFNDTKSPGWYIHPDTNNGRQYAAHFCNNDIQTFRTDGTCPNDRTPHIIWGTEEFSFTTDVPGLVEWRTWYPIAEGDYQGEHTLDEQRGKKLPRGLYNMVVMVHDVALKEASDDAAVYYPGDLDDDAMKVYTADEGRLVFDKRTNKRFPYKSKVPLDYLLYLYEGPVGFCAKGCSDNKRLSIAESLQNNANSPNYNADGEHDPLYAGVPTYNDADGIYGSSFPFDEVDANRMYGAYPPPNFAADGTTPGMDQLLRRWSQECTICLYGQNDNGTYDGVDCTGFIGEDGQEGYCGMNETSGNLVPIAAACRHNTPPYFTKTKNYTDGPAVDTKHGNRWLDDAYLAKPMFANQTLTYSSTGLWYEWQCTENKCFNLPTVNGTDNSIMTWETGWTHARWTDEAWQLANPGLFSRLSATGGKVGGNMGPYLKVENNPGIHLWWEASDYVDFIVPQVNETNQTDVETTRGVLRYPKNDGYQNDGREEVERGYHLSTITVYKSEPFDFYVSAKDDDDCAELRLVNTGLPGSEATTVDGLPVEATMAEVLDPELFSYYPEFPQGFMVRRNFIWRAPRESSLARPKLDTRPEYSFVCFYATDGYLLTNKPTYCIELIIVEKPPEIEELNECFCRTCSEEGKYVATREARPVMNYAPRVDAYKQTVDNIYQDELTFVPRGDYVGGVNGTATQTSGTADSPMGEKRKKK